MRVKIFGQKRRLERSGPGEVTLAGPPPLAVALRRSAQARRFTLRVSRLTGEAVLTLPSRAPLAEAEAFLIEREGWLRQNMEGAQRAEPPRLGGVILFEGGELTLVEGAVRAPRREGGLLVVPPGGERLSPRLAAWLKAEARARLMAASERHAATLGLPFGKLTLRDTKGRWGSCNSAGDLMFSWRLVMAPPEVLDYVAAHEVAHLAEMNHSPAFWAVCARLCPDHQAQRRWLKVNGARLHALRLKD